MPQFGEPPTPSEVAALDRDPGMRNLGEADIDAYHQAIKDTDEKRLATSLTGAAFARRLGIADAELIRSSVSSAQVEGETRYWAWQLVPNDSGVDRLLPHLKRVLSAIPSDLDGLSVSSLITNTQNDLLIEGRSVTPIVWITIGQPVEAVLDLLEATDLGY